MSLAVSIYNRTPPTVCVTRLLAFRRLWKPRQREGGSALHLGWQSTFPPQRPLGLGRCHRNVGGWREVFSSETVENASPMLCGPQQVGKGSQPSPEGYRGKERLAETLIW